MLKPMRNLHGRQYLSLLRQRNLPRRRQLPELSPELPHVLGSRSLLKLRRELLLEYHDLRIMPQQVRVHMLEERIEPSCLHCMRERLLQRRV